MLALLTAASAFLKLLLTYVNMVLQELPPVYCSIQCYATQSTKLYTRHDDFTECCVTACTQAVLRLQLENQAMQCQQ